MSVPPPRRRYTPRPDSGSPIHAQDRIARLFSASVLGGVVGIWGWFAGVGFLPGAVVGAIAGYATARWAVPGAAAAFNRWLHPSGGTTPMPRGLSAGEALQAQGDYEAAIQWYESVLEVSPGDPEPALRIARICRDHLGLHEAAVRWFRRARAIGLPHGGELLVTREIIEVFDQKLGEPQRAIPELARLADRFPHESIADWARSELARRRAETV